MMITFRHVLEMILNPFLLCLILYAFFLSLLWLYGNKYLVKWGFTLVLVLLLIFSTGWLPQALTRKLEDEYPAVITANPRVPWVVVFGGGQSEVKERPANALLSLSSLKRLIEGVRLYRQLPHAKLLLSGGGYQFEVAEATRLSQVAAWLSIPREDIVLETNSINTADEAREIKVILQNQPFYLVTSAIHMSRSMRLCHAQGLHPIPAPTDYTYFWNNGQWEKTVFPNPYNLFYLSIAMHELLGNVWSRWHPDSAPTKNQ
jgi:uncharacterized SAM-binding protein YcdF (DUF218 family)